MKRLDKAAIKKYGIPGLLLMENAGRAVAFEVLRHTAGKGRKIPKPIVAIFCGKGNNGGDGMVCARYLFNSNIDTRAYIIGEKSQIAGDPAVHLNILEKMGVKIGVVKDSRGLSSLKKRFKADVIVDSIFGIGFTGTAEGIFKKIIEFINSQPAYTISVDIPSGINATTGEAKGACIKADETITMHLAKIGLYKGDGLRCVGRVKVVDIGLPKQIKDGAIWPR